MALAVGTAAGARDAPAPHTPRLLPQGRTVNMTSLIELTFQINPDIAAARYDLQAAEEAFREFERDLNQLTPLSLRADTWRTVTRDAGVDEGLYAHDVAVGPRKEFFNGASMSIEVGHAQRYETDEGAHFFAGARLRFPLFGSQTTLKRITQRSFEETRRLDMQLRYVEVVRDRIHAAQGFYVIMQAQLSRCRLAEDGIRDFEAVLALPRAAASPPDQRQLESEIGRMKSEITTYQGQSDQAFVDLQSGVGADGLLPAQVDPLNLYADGHYGTDYLRRTQAELLARAIRNDVEIQVLENGRNLAIEKRRLAERGRWDIFLNFRAAGELEGEGARDGDAEFRVDAGMEVRLIDPILLDFARRKAEAQIRWFDARIESRRMAIGNLVGRDVIRLVTMRDKAEQQAATVASRHVTYQQKLQAYAEGRETIDNLVRARSDLYNTALDRSFTMAELFHAITRLDRASNAYFQSLDIGIAVNGIAPGRTPEPAR